MPDSNVIQINTSVPMSIHPQTLAGEVAALNIDGSPGKAALEATQQGLTEMYSTLSVVDEAYKATHAAFGEKHKADLQMAARTKVLMPGMHMTDDGKIAIHLDPVAARELNSTIDGAFQRAAPKLDNALKVVRETRKVVDAEVAKAIHDPNGSNLESVSMARETRDYVRSLSQPERAEFITAAIKGGDLATVSAVLGPNAKPFLTGLAPGMHAHLLGEAQRAFAPVAASQAASLARLENAIIKAGSDALGRFIKSKVPVQEKFNLSVASLNKLRATGGAS
jgi:hypothetical protein